MFLLASIGYIVFSFFGGRDGVGEGIRGRWARQAFSLFVVLFGPFVAFQIRLLIKYFEQTQAKSSCISFGTHNFPFISLFFWYFFFICFSLFWLFALAQQFSHWHTFLVWYNGRRKIDFLELFHYAHCQHEGRGKRTNSEINDIIDVSVCVSALRFIARI